MWKNSETWRSRLWNTLLNLSGSDIRDPDSGTQFLPTIGKPPPVHIFHGILQRLLLRCQPDGKLTDPVCQNKACGKQLRLGKIKPVIHHRHSAPVALSSMFRNRFSDRCPRQMKSFSGLYPRKTGRDSRRNGPFQQLYGIRTRSFSVMTVTKVSGST